jgi:hypothetical protein
MNRAIPVAVLFGGLLPTALAHAHGQAIQVEPSSGMLIVVGGIDDANGYASQVFVESDSAGDPQFPAAVPYPPCSSCTVWNVPGFEIAGMAEHSKLRLELVPRPSNVGDSAENRLLWYWNPLKEEVEEAPAEATFYLRALGNQSMALTAATTLAPPPIQIAEPLAADQGFHNHGLLGYALSANPAAPAGAYGFFARLTSDQYTPSDPILVVINHIDHLSGAPDYAQIVPAALVINSAAFLPGDYNHNDVVDAADYTVWRDTLGQAGMRLPADGSGNQFVDQDDYLVWRDNFGREFEGSAASGGPPPTAATLPEPSSISQLLLVAVANFPTTWRRIRRGYGWSVKPPADGRIRGLATNGWNCRRFRKRRTPIAA